MIMKSLSFVCKEFYGMTCRLNLLAVASMVTLLNIYILLYIFGVNVCSDDMIPFLPLIRGTILLGKGWSQMIM